MEVLILGDTFFCSKISFINSVQFSNICQIPKLGLMKLKHITNAINSLKSIKKSSCINRTVVSNGGRWKTAFGFIFTPYALCPTFSLLLCILKSPISVLSPGVDSLWWFMWDGVQINLNNGPKSLRVSEEQQAAVTHCNKQWSVLLNICRDLPLNIHAAHFSRMCQPLCEKTKINITNSILISIRGPWSQLRGPNPKGTCCIYSRIHFVLLMQLWSCTFLTLLPLTLYKLMTCLTSKRCHTLELWLGEIKESDI